MTEHVEASGDAPEAAAKSTTPANSKSSAGPVSAEVLKKWDQDIETINDSLALMLANRLADAEQKLDEAVKEVETRSIDFNAGEHDLRGCFAFARALISLINGLASMEDGQLQLVLDRVWAADALVVLDSDWAGRTVLRGLCLLVAGLVEVMQGAATRGIWHILRSWLWLRSLESEALNFEGHESNVVRSTALLALGVFNLLVSMLPPQAMRTATWITGFKGGRETALLQLRMCWSEGGIQAPFAALVLIGFSADVCTFLGELREVRDKRCEEVKAILDWAAKLHPNSFFFRGLEASYFSAIRDLDGAVSSVASTADIVQDLPAFLLLVHAKMATFRLAQFAWPEAAAAFRAALQVHREVGRRALCPTFALNAYLCHTAAGQPKEAQEALQLSRSYLTEKKKWGLLDKKSLKQAELAHSIATGGEASPSSKGNAEPEVWDPVMELYMKVCVIYRAVCFMKEDQVAQFLDMIKAQMALRADDVDTRCIGLFIQAEALRQAEMWDEAVKVCDEGLALQSKITDRSRGLSAIHFFHMVRAFAHYAKGKLAVAKADLHKLQNVGGTHFFHRNVDFKVTYLGQLLGEELEDSTKQTSVAVGARRSSKLVIEIPAGTEEVDYDWTLVDFTITFVAVFRPANSEGGAQEVELHREEQRKSDAGPFCGTFQPPSAGVLEMTFDNSFSMLRAKNLKVNVRPETLSTRVEQ
mmetsp:Transcript_17324/g.40367  ORF Transcript_17324/g.40367 Transcript_17324/m.40367 type:complete len:701 (-) Transcript_17324:141-2243(-)